MSTQRYLSETQNLLSLERDQNCSQVSRMAQSRPNFNKYLHGLFLWLSKTFACICAGNTILYESHKEIHSLHKRLEYSSLIHTEQPESNYTRLTQGKYSGAMA